MTPVGILEYSAAKVKVDVGDQATSFAVDSGAAFLWVAEDATPFVAHAKSASDAAASAPAADAPWERMSPGDRVRVGGAGASFGPKAAVATCGARADRAEELAQAMLAAVMARFDGGDPHAQAAEGGRLAADQVRGRRIARAACTLAEMRVAMAPASESREAMAQVVRAASARWARVPLLPAQPGEAH